MMMRVYGQEITAEQEAAALAAMTGSFRAFDVEVALTRAGVQSGSVQSRAADRLLQRERKAGRIHTDPDNKRRWIAKAIEARQGGDGEAGSVHELG